MIDDILDLSKMKGYPGQKINTASLAEQVYELLRTRIINLEVPLGERLDVSRLQEELGVSRAPIREALQKLREGRLVDIKPRVGYFILTVSSNDIKDIYDMRKLLETYALREVIKKIPTSRFKGLMDEILSLRHKKLPRAELRKRFDETDYALHQELILNNCQNRFLHDFAERINSFVTIAKHLNQRIEKASDEHLKILKAILRKDANEAEKLLIAHLDNAKHATLESFRVCERN